MTASDGRVDLAVELSRDREALLARSGTADQVAYTLRGHIMQGHIQPGSHLSEEALASGLGVSRNTIREAFRLLSHERLVIHELNKGVSVAVPRIEDLTDVYRVRRTVETAAAAMADSAPRAAVTAVRAAVNEGHRAAAVDNWTDVGTADVNFHQAVAELAGSQRLNEMMRRVLAELRLCFHIMDDPVRFHSYYLPWNEKIAALIESGAGAGAAQELDAYLTEAEAQVLGAYRNARKGIQA
jgi:DNA-binding GntR family transcriptional regulator